MNSGFRPDIALVIAGSAFERVMGCTRKAGTRAAGLHI
jgi:hypothetical protein